MSEVCCEMCFGKFGSEFVGRGMLKIVCIFG